MSPAVRRRPAAGKKRGIHPLVIAGISVFLVVAITYYAFSQSLPFQHRYTLYALVNNSVNVRTDSPVRIAGIDVGVVQGTRPAGNLTKIVFNMDGNGLPIHNDATLRIRDRLFLEGGYYLELDPGTPGAPLVHDGFTIPPAQTSTPVQFFNILSNFTAPQRDALRNLLITLNQGFSPQPGHPNSQSGAGGLKAAVPQLTSTLKDFAWVTRGLRGTHAGDVETLLSSSSNITSTLAGSSAPLGDLVTSLNRVSSALASTDGALAQSVAGLDQTLQVAPAALFAVDRSLPPLAALAVALDPSLKLAPPLIDALIRTVGQLGQVVAPAERARLLTTLKATFAQFPSILTKLATAFPLTKQVTDCLQTHVIPSLKSVVPDGPLTSGRPVWQDFVHFLPNVAGASGNFDANGPYVRVLANAGTQTLGAGGLFGTLPILGTILGTAPPGGGSLLGARPAWIGDLKPSVFRPDVRCSSQKLPSLVAPAAAPDLTPRASSPAPTAKQRAAVAQLLGRIDSQQRKVRR